MKLDHTFKNSFDDLTDNQKAALKALVENCLDGMGGEHPLDLRDDEYTWAEPEDLVHAGWTKDAAKATFNELIDADAVQSGYEDGLNGDEMYAVATSAWEWLAHHWKRKFKPDYNHKPRRKPKPRKRGKGYGGRNNAIAQAFKRHCRELKVKPNTARARLRKFYRDTHTLGTSWEIPTAKRKLATFNAVIQGEK